MGGRGKGGRGGEGGRGLDAGGWDRSQGEGGGRMEMDVHGRANEGRRRWGGVKLYAERALNLVSKIGG